MPEWNLIYILWSHLAPTLFNLSPHGAILRPQPGLYVIAGMIPIIDLHTLTLRAAPPDHLPCIALGNIQKLPVCEEPLLSHLAVGLVGWI